MRVGLSRLVSVDRASKLEKLHTRIRIRSRGTRARRAEALSRRTNDRSLLDSVEVSSPPDEAVRLL